MAREAVKVAGTGQTTRTYTISDANAISKGTLMVLTTDPNTASSSTTTSSGAMFAGIALEAKEADDGQTTLAVDISGQWDLVASGAITLGHKVIVANGANYVQAASVNGSVATQGTVVGVCMETAADAETVTIDLDRR